MYAAVSHARWNPMGLANRRRGNLCSMLGLGHECPPNLRWVWHGLTRTSNRRAETHLAIQEFTFTNLGEVLHKKSLVRIESIFAVGSSSPIKAFQKLANRLLIIDALLHLA